jgi:NAD(P)-dependent dehydrogenase (short-subunit alcohol dehydrogenase family)
MFILDRIKETTPETLPDRAREFAVSAGVDPDAVLAGLSDENLLRAVQADRALGDSRGVRRTPTVFVNGEMFVETIASQELSAAIERGLSDARPTALITGASRGIGRGIAIELARTHRVLGTYRGNREAADSLAAETGALLFQCDVASRADRDSLLAFAKERLGRLDLLVNNAGMAVRDRCDMLDATEESFDELIGTNLKGPHFLTQAAARWMVRQGSGRIVFITSISSFTASVNRAEYCISKAGLSMTVALFAQRLAAANVQVFEIQPGIIRTDMIAAVESVYEERIANGLLPQRRMGQLSYYAALMGGNRLLYQFPCFIPPATKEALRSATVKEYVF